MNILRDRVKPDDIAVPKTRKRRPLDLKDEKDQHLIENIRRVGFLHPIQVRATPAASKPYELVFGQRRLAVAKHLGLEVIPASVVEMTEEQTAFISMSENVMRRPMEYAEYLRALKGLLGEIEKLFGPDPGHTLCGKAAAAKAVRNAETKTFMKKTATTDAEKTRDEPVSSHGLLTGVEEETKPETPAQVAHHTIVQHETGRSRETTLRDMKLAKAFDDDDLRVLQAEQVPRAKMLELAALSPDARQEAIALIACGDPIDQAIAAAVAKDEKEKAEAGSKPKAIPEADLSDADWLATSCAPVRSQLEDTTTFDREALLYRRTREARSAFRAAVKEETNKTKSKGFGPLSLVTFNAIYVEHPNDWYLCSACNGQNVTNKECDLCSGTGFRLKYGGPKK